MHLWIEEKYDSQEKLTLERFFQSQYNLFCFSDYAIGHSNIQVSQLISSLI